MHTLWNKQKGLQCSHTSLLQVQYTNVQTFKKYPFKGDLGQNSQNKHLKMNNVVKWKYMVEFMNIAQRCYNHKKAVYQPSATVNYF